MESNSFNFSALSFFFFSSSLFDFFVVVVVWSFVFGLCVWAFLGFLVVCFFFEGVFCFVLLLRKKSSTAKEAAT